MRVVIDTNVWISGLLWKGSPWKILRLVEEQKIEAWATTSMLIELETSLAYPRLQPRLIELNLEIIDLLAFAADQVSLIELERIEPVVKDDPDDDVFVSCALAAQARYIISGNKHLLKLERWQEMNVVTPHEFLAREFPELEGR